MPTTPHSAKDNYFPHVNSTYDSPHSRQSSLGPQTPTSATRPVYGAYAYTSTNSYGLGEGLSENEGRTAGSSPEALRRSQQITTTNMVIFDESAGGTPKSPQLTKPKRKPVPRMLVGDELTEKMEGLQMIETHAL